MSGRDFSEKCGAEDFFAANGKGNAPAAHETAEACRRSAGGGGLFAISFPFFVIA